MKHAQRTLAALAGLLAAGTASGVAQAATQLKVIHDGFGQKAIEVISEDGISWTKIKSKAIDLPITIGAGKTDHLVYSYRLYQPGGGGFLVNEAFSDGMPVRVDKSFLLTGSTTNISTFQRTQILQACNAGLDRGETVAEGHDLIFGPHVQLAVSFSKEGFSSSGASGLGEEIGQGSALLPLKCLPAKPKSTGGPVSELDDMKVKDLKLFLGTFSHAVSKPSLGKECKKGRIHLRAKTNQAGPVKLKLWTKVGNQPIKGEVIDVVSTHAGSGIYKAEVKKWISVSKTSVVQAKVEDLVTQPIGAHDGWKDITLRCSAPGGLGLADVPSENPGDGGTLIPLKVVGNLTLGDHAGAAQFKPRTGTVTFRLVSNRAGKTSYRLACGSGREWTGTVNTKSHVAGKFRAVGTHKFAVTKTVDVKCALRSMSMPGMPAVALAERLYVVKEGRPTAGGPDELKGDTGTPRPTHSAARELERLKKLRELRKRREAAKKAAEAKRRREAAKKAALAKKRREAAKKAAEARKRRDAAKRAADARRRREAQKKAAQARQRRIEAQRQRQERARRLQQSNRLKSRRTSSTRSRANRL